MKYDSIWNTCNCTYPNQINSGFACVTCTDLCLETTCTNSSSTSCVKCNCPCLNGFYLNAGKTCSACNYDSLNSSSSSCTCPSNMYNGSDNNSCKECHYACLTCLGPGT